MRFQTKFKRRREGKTDYFARKRLVTQNKDKYNTPKYRLVARITSTRVIAQVIYSTIQGDRVFCAADSTELRKWGLTSGLSNYAAAYATGLLIARRLLNKVGLSEILDVGLKATTTGSKVFAVMKGAADGGVSVPHSDSRFPGKTEKDENKFLRKRILGGHIDDYMKSIKGTEKETLQFRKWNECLKSSGSASVEKLFQKIHDEIRKSPDHTKKAVKTNPKRDHSKYSKSKISRKQKKANAKKKIEIRLKELKKQQKKA
ncbi:UNVERIFIED_CONTAM: hypothetical protein GTU68_005125 [Idotea baltica]|nr:hypothetical protein [Idotea baltica]